MRLFITAIVLAVCLGLGILAPKLPELLALASGHSLYSASSFDAAKQDINVIGWSDLLPPDEREAIERFRSDDGQSFEDQMFNAILAAKDDDYQQMSTSMNTVASLRNQIIQIPGFLVPVDVENNKRATSFFIVPYFGACLHYPAPPPNQMIYAYVREGIEIPDLDSAYLFTGMLTPDPYEDVMGTSAYHLVLYSMQNYRENPDDLRSQ